MMNAEDNELTSLTWLHSINILPRESDKVSDKTKTEGFCIPPPKHSSEKKDVNQRISNGKQQKKRENQLISICILFLIWALCFMTLMIALTTIFFIVSFPIACLSLASHPLVVDNSTMTCDCIFVLSDPAVLRDGSCKSCQDLSDHCNYCYV